MNPVVKGFLANHKWELVRADSKGMLPEGQLVRMMKFIPYDMACKMRDALEMYTDVCNEECSACVKDPMISGKKWSGTYRHISTVIMNETEARDQRVIGRSSRPPEGKQWVLVQTLARECHESLEWRDARCANTRHYGGTTTATTPTRAGKTFGCSVGLASTPTRRMS